MSLLNGPGEGTWAVFAEKVVKERDEALEALAAEKARADALAAALTVAEPAITHSVYTASGWMFGPWMFTPAEGAQIRAALANFMGVPGETANDLL